MAIVGIIDILMRGDNSQFDAAAKKSKQSLEQVNQGFTLAKAGSIAMSGAMAVVTAAVAAGTAALTGFGIAAAKTYETMLDDAEASKKAFRMELNIDEYETLAEAFEKIGLAADDVGGTLDKMTIAIENAISGDDDPFAKLGLSAKELSKLPVYEKFQKINEALSKIDNMGERKVLEKAIFGKEGAKLDALLRYNDSLDQARAKLEKFGTLDDPLEGIMAEKAIKNLGELKLSFQSIWEEVSSKVTPSVATTFAVMRDGAMEGKTQISAVSDAVVLLESLWWGVAEAIHAASIGMTKASTSVHVLAALAKAYKGDMRGVAESMMAAADSKKNEEALSKKSGWQIWQEQKAKLEAEAQKTLADRQKERDQGAASSGFEAEQKLIENLNKLKEGDPLEKLRKSLQQIGQAYERNILTEQQALDLARKAQEELTGTKDLYLDAAMRVDKLNEAWRKGFITFDQCEAGLKKIRQEITGIDDPFAKFTEKTNLLDESLANGIISWEEYTRAVQDARKSILGVDLTPQQQMDRWRENVKKMKASGVEGDQLNNYAQSTLPNYIKQMQQATATPMQKLGEQLAQLEQYRGGMGEDLYNRSKAYIMQQSGIGGEHKLANAAEYGSTDARNIILSNRMGTDSNNPQVAMLDVERKALAEYQKHNTKLDTLISVLSGDSGTTDEGVDW